MDKLKAIKYFIVFFGGSLVISIIIFDKWIKPLMFPSNFKYRTYIKMSYKEKQEFAFYLNNYYLSSFVETLGDSAIMEMNDFFRTNIKSKDSILIILELYFEGEREWSEVLVKNKVVTKELGRSLITDNTLKYIDGLFSNSIEVSNPIGFTKWLKNIFNNQSKLTAKDKKKDSVSIVSGKSIIIMNWPLQTKSRNITSGFGYRYHPIFKKRKMHFGIDIGVPKNTIVISTSAGRLKDFGYNKSRGNFILIDHGNGVISSYCHLNKITLNGKSKIKRGQPIGLVGSTGYSTGPHLHFEISVNGKRIDPLKFKYVK